LRDPTSGWRLVSLSIDVILSTMNDQYRRLAVFVDNPRPGSFLWLLIESTDDPAVWLDAETGDETYETWIDAFTAGNEALISHVDDELVGPVRVGEAEDEDSDS